VKHHWFLLAALGLGCTGKEAVPAPEPGTVPAAPPPPVETTGLIGRAGTGLTLLGKPLEVGDPIPSFDLAALATDPATGAPQHLDSASLAGKVLVVSVVPSIDTRVCELQTGKMAEQTPNLGDDVHVLTVSRDLPFAQRRFIEDNQFKIDIASDFRGGSFGTAWGIAVKETGLLARSVWVVGKDGTIRYRELVADQSTEPDYEPLWAAARAAAAE